MIMMIVSMIGHGALGSAKAEKLWNWPTGTEHSEAGSISLALPPLPYIFRSPGREH